MLRPSVLNFVFIEKMMKHKIKSPPKMAPSKKQLFSSPAQFILSMHSCSLDILSIIKEIKDGRFNSFFDLPFACFKNQKLQAPQMTSRSTKMHWSHVISRLDSHTGVSFLD